MYLIGKDRGPNRFFNTKFRRRFRRRREKKDFVTAGFVDFTFTAFSDCASFFDQCTQKSEDEALRGLCVVPLFAVEGVPIVVHLYNPFVADEDIRVFLAWYCITVSEGEKIRGRFGIWNGKHRFLANLWVDPAVPGGTATPSGKLFHRPSPQFSITRASPSTAEDVER